MTDLDNWVTSDTTEAEIVAIFKNVSGIFLTDYSFKTYMYLLFTAYKFEVIEKNIEKSILGCARS